jgi:hypothetical protein
MMRLAVGRVMRLRRPLRISFRVLREMAVTLCSRRNPIPRLCSHRRWLRASVASTRACVWVSMPHRTRRWWRSWLRA